MKTFKTTACLFALALFQTPAYSQGVEWIRLASSSYHENFNQTDNGRKTATDKKGNIFSAVNIDANAVFGSTALDAKAFDLYICKYNRSGKFSWMQKIEVGDPYDNFIQAIET